VYRIHRPSAQTRYSFSTGFSAKNHTTILNYTSALSRFGLAHLNQQTNISSPFISVYDNLAHAEQVAKHWADKWGEEVLVVSVDTRHFARGPVFRAADLLKVCFVCAVEMDFCGGGGDCANGVAGCGDRQGGRVAALGRVPGHVPHSGAGD
jgi:hypothetical protein